MFSFRKFTSRGDLFIALSQAKTEENTLDTKVLKDLTVYDSANDLMAFIMLC